MANAIKITTAGTVTAEQINGLEDLQHHVGGWVEAIGSDDTEHTVWLNEDGKVLGLPLNPTAHPVVHELITGLDPRDLIVGPVLITGPLAEDGQTYQSPTAAMRARFNLA